MAAESRLTISVAMTTFQGERHLGEQLASILGQSRLPDEIVVSDDASSDRTWEILQSAAEGSPVPFRLLRNPERLGLRRNVESALANVSGDVIVLADQDDLWSREKVATIVSSFADPEVALWFSDGTLIDEHGEPLGGTAWESIGFGPEAQRSVREGAGLGRLLHGQTVTGATMAVCGSIVRLALPLPEELEGADHLYLHDGWLAVLAALLGRVVVESTPLTSYRQHKGQVTGMSMTAPANAGAEPRGRNDRSAQLLRDHAGVKLVAERVRSRGLTAPPSNGSLSELWRREEFLDARTMRRGEPGRRRRIWEQVRLGSYGTRPSGLRTALADLLLWADRS